VRSSTAATSTDRALLGWGATSRRRSTYSRTKRRLRCHSRTSSSTSRSSTSETAKFCLQGGRDGSQDEIVWGETFAEEAQNDAMSVEQAEQALLTAVRRQLVADVEVGVFLSGGLDSTLVLSAAAGLGARPQAFSLGFAGHGDYDEAGPPPGSQHGSEYLMTSNSSAPRSTAASTRSGRPV
jgi:Asparagine synthase